MNLYSRLCITLFGVVVAVLGCHYYADGASDATITKAPNGVVALSDSLILGEDFAVRYLDALESVPTHRELQCQRREADSLAAVERWLSRDITIACVGDMMLGTNYPDGAPRLPIKDGAHLFDDVREYLVSADIAVGNLEGVLLNRGGTVRTVKDEKYAFFFRMPERYINHFKAAGFDFLSIANNHQRDFGDEGLRSTLRVLKNSGIGYAGVRNRCELWVMERDGVKYGFCAFAPFLLMCDIHDYNLARKLIKQLREEHKCDIVIVSHHGGAEGSDAYRVPREREFFGGGYRGNVYDFAHVCVDAGADLVYGHGPHVVRGMELYKGKLIAYSLGNFCTPYGMNIRGRNGYAPILLVNLSTSGEFRGGRIISATQTTRTGPKRDSAQVVVREIQRLSRMDFPESKLRIDDDGYLYVVE